MAISGVGVAVWAFTSSRSTPAAPSPSLELSPHEVTTFSVGPNGQTNAILAAQGSVWVTAYGVEGGGGVDRDALFRIDPATNGVIATIPLETAPTNEVGGGGLTYADGSIWVTGGGRLQGEEPEALLQRVNPVTNEVVATIPLGGQFGSDVTGGAGAVWVAIFGDRSAEVV
ncbi:MAG TPA: hypothetical protein VFA25_00590, partial [Actinomycetota bacterium]|nr:hypothetical protein [Actinomycetota bacterium]